MYKEDEQIYVSITGHSLVIIQVLDTEIRWK